MIVFFIIIGGRILIIDAIRIGKIQQIRRRDIKLLLTAWISVIDHRLPIIIFDDGLLILRYLYEYKAKKSFQKYLWKLQNSIYATHFVHQNSNFYNHAKFSDEIVSFCIVYLLKLNRPLVALH